VSLCLGQVRSIWRQWMVQVRRPPRWTYRAAVLVGGKVRIVMLTQSSFYELADRGAPRLGDLNRWSKIKCPQPTDAWKERYQ
jgi:hypothetical protein